MYISAHRLAEYIIGPKIMLHCRKHPSSHWRNVFFECCINQHLYSLGKRILSIFCEDFQNENTKKWKAIMAMKREKWWIVRGSTGESHFLSQITQLFDWYFFKCAFLECFSPPLRLLVGVFRLCWRWVGNLVNERGVLSDGRDVTSWMVRNFESFDELFQRCELMTDFWESFVIFRFFRSFFGFV